MMAEGMEMDDSSKTKRVCKPPEGYVLVPREADRIVRADMIYWSVLSQRWNPVVPGMIGNNTDAWAAYVMAEKVKGK